MGCNCCKEDDVRRDDPEIPNNRGRRPRRRSQVPAAQQIRTPVRAPQPQPTLCDICGSTLDPALYDSHRETCRANHRRQIRTAAQESAATAAAYMTPPARPAKEAQEPTPVGPNDRQDGGSIPGRGVHHLLRKRQGVRVHPLRAPRRVQGVCAAAGHVPGVPRSSGRLTVRRADVEAVRVQALQARHRAHVLRLPPRSVRPAHAAAGRSRPRARRRGRNRRRGAKLHRMSHAATRTRALALRALALLRPVCAESKDLPSVLHNSHRKPTNLRFLKRMSALVHQTCEPYLETSRYVSSVHVCR